MCLLCVTNTEGIILPTQSRQAAHFSLCIVCTVQDLSVPSQLHRSAAAPWLIPISHLANYNNVSWPGWMVAYEDSVSMNGLPCQY